MNIACPCRTWPHTVNPDLHPCVWVAPWQAAALIARPVQTVHTWRKQGRIGARRDPEDGRWQVCNCEAAGVAGTSEARWSRKTRRAS